MHGYECSWNDILLSHELNCRYIKNTRSNFTTQTLYINASK